MSEQGRAAVTMARTDTEGEKERREEGKKSTYDVLLDAVCDALDDVVHDGLVVPVRLVVPEAHHAPVLVLRVPMDLDHAVVELLVRVLHPAFRARGRTQSAMRQATRGEKEADRPLPFVVRDVHYVVELIARHAAVVAAPDMQLEDGLRLEVGYLGLPRRRCEAEDELEVYRIFRRGLPLQTTACGEPRISQAQGRERRMEDEKDGEEARGAHIGIRAGRVRRADACVDEPVISVLKLRYVDVEYIFHAVRELDLLHFKPNANANFKTPHQMTYASHPRTEKVAVMPYEGGLASFFGTVRTPTAVTAARVNLMSADRTEVTAVQEGGPVTHAVSFVQRPGHYVLLVSDKAVEGKITQGFL